MASIRKRGPKQWEVRIRRKGHTPPFRTFEYKADADAWAAEAESKLRRGERLASGSPLRMTLHDVLVDFEKYRLPNLKGHQPAYLIAYWKEHPLAQRRIREFRGHDIRDWIAERKADDVWQYLRHADNKVQYDETGEPIEVPVRKVGPKTVYND